MIEEMEIKMRNLLQEVGHIAFLPRNIQPLPAVNREIWSSAVQ